MKLSVVVICSVAGIGMSGCMTVKPDSEAIGPYPSNYKEIVKEYVEKSYFDPYSMKSVAITHPVEGHLYFQQGWIVCLQANAKNKIGGYTGLKRNALLINNYSVTQSMTNAPLCKNSQLSYFPWSVLGEGESSNNINSESGSASPSLAKKERWIQIMAQKNGCSGAVKVTIKSKVGIREIYDTTCGQSTMEFTCEFDGPVSLGSGGIPFVEVTGKSYSVKPACWR